MINTTKIFKENELDKGFILRANDTVARIMREIIHSSSTDEKASNHNIDIINLDPNKKLYG